MTSKFICVFAGSNAGSDPAYIQVAQQLGTELAARGYGLVYGGAHVGLMGAVADSALEAGAPVVGVMPDFLVAKEIAHPRITELKITTSMHERKDIMGRLSDGFIALPGGFGTLEEFFEVLTWAQLRLHAKPCGILNVNGYYNFLISFLDTAVTQRLLNIANRSLVLTSSTPSSLLDLMEAFSPPTATKWIDTYRT